MYHSFSSIDRSCFLWRRFFSLFYRSPDPFHFLQNDISDVVGVFFSVDADEEKHILYEKTEVFHLLSMQEIDFSF